MFFDYHQLFPITLSLYKKSKNRRHTISMAHHIFLSSVFLRHHEDNQVKFTSNGGEGSSSVL